jgi:uncharacterized membrane protein YfcA
MKWLHTLDLPLIFKVAVAGLGGLITGFIGGMVGLALGRPRLLLVYWAADNPINAAGTNILVSAVAALTGTWEHFRERRINLQVLLLMGIPSALGAFLGGYIGDMVPRSALLVVVGVLTTWYGCTLLLGKRGQRPRNPGVQRPVVPQHRSHRL